MKITLVLTLFLIISCSIHANEVKNIKEITTAISNLCHKPDKAGEYWDVKLSGTAGANVRIKLKLADLGITGDAKFNKGEWKGIKDTIENSQDYRECAKVLTPIFLDKFQMLINQPLNNSVKRKLSGIRWEDINSGVEITLNRCLKNKTILTCYFTISSKEDSLVYIDLRSASTFDQEGNKFHAQKVTIANQFAHKSKTSGINVEIIQNVKTKMVLQFEGIFNSSYFIKKIVFDSKIKNKSANSSHRYTYRDMEVML